MPAKVIGMIGVEPPTGTSLHVIAGGISPSFVAEFAQLHEKAGFDQVLVGYYASSADGFGVASYAAAHTKTLSYLIAHRPGVVSPTLAARTIATFDHFSRGRISLHVIAGVSDQEQQSEGDFLPKDGRYKRATEYLEIMRHLWTKQEPFDFEGEYYKIRQGWSAVKPFQSPYPTLFFGGSSEGALAMGSKHCDVHALYGEPLKETAERIQEFRQRAGKYGRVPGFNVSFRPIIAETEGKAWDKAYKLLADLKGQKFDRPGQDRSAERMLEIAKRGEIHDERLWMSISEVTGARGNTTCLVGTSQQVAEAMLKYYRLGAASFLIRGFDPVVDTEDYGRELIPRLKAGAMEIDREQADAA